MAIRQFLAGVGFLASAFLVACGGGGSNSSGAASTTNPAPTGTFTPLITTTNATSLIYDGAIGFNNSKDGRLVYLLVSNLAQSGISAYLGAGKTTSCTISGSTTRVVTDNDSNGIISAGDVITTNFTSCISTSGGASGTGTITDNITALSSSINPATTGTAWTASITEITNLTLNTASATTTITSTIPHSLIIKSDDTLSVVSTPSAFSYAYVPTVPGTAYSLTGLVGSTTYTGTIYASSVYAYKTSFVVTGTDAMVNSGATFSIGMYTPVTASGTYQGAGIHLAPTSGSFKVLGASSTSTSSSAPFSSIALDSNGDGVTDTTGSVTYLSSWLTP
jgi:hypothetical protein